MYTHNILRCFPKNQIVYTAKCNTFCSAYCFFLSIFDYSSFYFNRDPAVKKMNEIGPKNITVDSLLSVMSLPPVLNQ